MTADARIIVAGHICLDITPTFDPAATASRIEPGKLYRVGPALFSTGGVVSNTGIALHRLGVPTRLIGKVADDAFGGQVLGLLRSIDSDLASGMAVSPAGDTSYSIVISPPRTDRSFIHCPGTNDTFVAADIPRDAFDNAEHLHFGYPPVMREIYINDGDELKSIFQRAIDAGLTTSLDMCQPDPESEAGSVNWRRWLSHVMPHTTIFLPSIEEITFMLGMDENACHQQEHWSAVADELLAMGTKAVVLKLGERGLYLKTGSRMDRPGWQDVEGHRPCFPVEVAGTNGAGDCTIAGFLAAFIDKKSPAECLTTAVAVGAFSVEDTGTTAGVPSMEIVLQRIQSDWTA